MGAATDGDKAMSRIEQESARMGVRLDEVGQAELRDVDLAGHR